MRLTRKIALLVAVPVIAMIAFAGLAVTVAITDAQRAARLSTLVSVSQRCAELTRALQEERAAAVARMLSPAPEATQAYLSATAATDLSVRELRSTWGGTPSAHSGWTLMIERTTPLPNRMVRTMPARISASSPPPRMREIGSRTSLHTAS